MPPLRVVAVVVGFVAVLAVVVVALASSRPEDEQFPFGTPDEFLERVQAAVASRGGIPHVSSETYVTQEGRRQALYSAEAWYEFPADAVRSSWRKAEGSELDLPDEVVELRVEEDDGAVVYVLVPGSGDATEKYGVADRPHCLEPGPELLVVGLVCGLGPQEGEWDRIEAEGPGEFRGAEVASLAAHMEDGRVLRLYVEANTYLPIAQTMTVQNGGETFVVETAFSVDSVERGSLPQDFFLPKGVGYVPEDEEWVRILDDDDLGMPVYWPGRALTGAAEYDAVLTDVRDKGGSQKSGPGHVLTLSYRGNGGLFRLDYWPGDTWESFVSSLGEGFLWANCSDEVTGSVAAGELTILRGYESPLGPVTLATPRVGAPNAGTTPEAPELFPDGCPSGDYDRFMAVVEVDGGVVTINAPYGYAGGRSAFEVYDSEAGLRRVAESLQLREAGE